jgi:hypothetical protein
VIAGDRNMVRRATGNAIESVAHVVPDRAEKWWGFRQTIHGMDVLARKIKEKPSSGDGVVSLKSARLEGVDDVVVIHGDHNSLFQPMDDAEPVAWETIRDRLKS